MKVYRIREGAKLPTKNDGEMCYDIYASFDINDPRIQDRLVATDGEWGIAVSSLVATKVPTGVKIALPPGYHASLRCRSGLAANESVHILGGQIDNTYRGEWVVLMQKGQYSDLIIRNGDKIAQFKLEKDETFPVEEVQTEAELGTTNRGEKGFGSSGR